MAESVPHFIVRPAGGVDMPYCPLFRRTGVAPDDLHRVVRVGPAELYDIKAVMTRVVGQAHSNSAFQWYHTLESVSLLAMGQPVEYECRVYLHKGSVPDARDGVPDGALVAVALATHIRDARLPLGHPRRYGVEVSVIVPVSDVMAVAGAEYLRTEHVDFHNARLVRGGPFKPPPLGWVKKDGMSRWLNVVQQELGRHLDRYETVTQIDLLE